MRKTTCLIALPLLLFTPPEDGLARPAETDPFESGSQPTETWRPIDEVHQAGRTQVFGVAQASTTYFGGTTWAADSMRWEAVIDSVWTFDSGVGSSFSPDIPYVNPYKSPGLHTLMEGWIGVDRTFVDNGEFRRLAMSDFPFDVCVGDSAFGAGVGGNYSFWAGLLPAEAQEACYVTGQGYGNNWKVCIYQVFNYDGDAGGVLLQYDFVNDTEPTYDFTRVYVDTSGDADGSGNVEITAYTGALSGSETVALSPGVELPAGAADIRISFCVTSDVAWSDEDGRNPTMCGAFTIDNISITGGGINHFADFETGDDGWVRLPAEPGPGGDWTDIVHRNELPPYFTECPCALEDSVLVLQDFNGGHGRYQNNFAASPWIDLKRHGLVGVPEVWIEGDAYFELPASNSVVFVVLYQFYPVVGAGGCLTTSGWYGNSGPGPDEPSCFKGMVPIGIPASAEQFRVAVGVRVGGWYSGISNSTPWYDNIRVGVTGNPSTGPLINLVGYASFPMDNFPANGSLRADAPARMDGSYWQGALLLGQMSPHDNLSIGVKGDGVEARVQFAVVPGPGIDSQRFTAWLTGHSFEGASRSLDWYSARMDTSKFGHDFGNFVTRYHEEDPNFTGTDLDEDPVDVDPVWMIEPDRAQVRFANDMFPDDLFTPGTRVNLFYKARYVGSATWSVAPDTSGGNYIEYEVLPSSMAADSTFNCVLFVNRSASGARWQAALSAVIPPAPGNFENTGYDHYDVILPNFGNNFGRPLNIPNGANVTQALGYKTILWGGGGGTLSRMQRWDADVLIPWLTLLDFPDHNFYLSGDNVGTQMMQSGGSPRRLLEDLCGVQIACNTFRDVDCPPQSARDNSDCVRLDPVEGARVADVARTEDPFGQGNGCPDQRSFDVLIPNATPDFGVPLGDEEYVGAAKIAQYASISNDATGDGPLSYKTVVDGIGVDIRRDAGACLSGAPPSAATENRLREVLQYFGYDNGGLCTDPTIGVGIGDTPVQTYIASLSRISPNPLTAGVKGRIQFTMSREDRARVDIFDINGRKVATVFDGTAPPGPNEVMWDGLDDRSRPVASGIYFYRLQTSDHEFARKLVVVRK